MSRNSINYVRGDLFAGVKAVIERSPQPMVFIPHVVNNEGRMGAGFVMPLKKRWPDVEADYVNWHKREMTLYNRFALGRNQHRVVEAGVLVVNMLAQTLGGGRPLSYSALGQCIHDLAETNLIRNHANGVPTEIHAPMFGSGLAGGNWQFIEQMILDSWAPVVSSLNIYFLPGQAPKKFAVDAVGKQVYENSKVTHKDSGREGLVEEIKSDTEMLVRHNDQLIATNPGCDPDTVDPIEYVMA